MTEPAAPRPRPADLADNAVARILADLDSVTTGEHGVVVDSPPGAGKSTLVVTATGHLIDQGHQVMVVAQTNDQVDDLVARLADRYPELAIGRLHNANHVLPPRAQRDQVTGSSKISDLYGLPVVVSTAAKWAYVDDGAWPWAIVDEAYQMRSDALLKVGRLFAEGRALFVGDPGQLDPFSIVNTDRWQGQTWNPLLNAVDVTLGHNPAMRQRELPVSWRLPASGAPLIQQAFYPFSSFVSGTGPDDRRLALATSTVGHEAVDRVIGKAVESGWGYLELPGRHTLTRDGELARALAATAHRLLERGVIAYCEPEAEGKLLTADRIAIGVTHNVQAEAVRQQLAAYGELTAGICVDTANKLQGREFDVTLVWHPLAGRADASTFHLETGRLCVLLSRHRHACIVVGRAGIRELLDAHPSTQPVYLDVAPKFPDGWRAHQSVMDHLLRPAHAARAGS